MSHSASCTDIFTQNIKLTNTHIFDQRGEDGIRAGQFS